MVTTTNGLDALGPIIRVFYILRMHLQFSI